MAVVRALVHFLVRSHFFNHWKYSLDIVIDNFKKPKMMNRQSHNNTETKNIKKVFLVLLATMYTLKPKASLTLSLN